MNEFLYFNYKYPSSLLALPPCRSRLVWVHWANSLPHSW